MLVEPSIDVQSTAGVGGPAGGVGLSPVLLRLMCRKMMGVHQAYSGEIAIDSSNGTILRLSLKTTGLKNTDPIFRAHIVVEYGPVELGGRSYYLPAEGHRSFRGIGGTALARFV